MLHSSCIDKSGGTILCVEKLTIQDCPAPVESGFLFPANIFIASIGGSLICMAFEALAKTALFDD